MEHNRFDNHRLRNIGVVLVVAGYGVHRVVALTFRTRVRANAERLRANTWLNDPGGGATLAGEMLIWASRNVGAARSNSHQQGEGKRGAG